MNICFAIPNLIAVSASALGNFRAFLQSDGAVILPELELAIFAIGVVFIDSWMESCDKYWNAVLALAGVGFSLATLWILRGRQAVSGDLMGFRESLLIDSFFLVFAGLLLAALLLVILLSVQGLRENKEQQGWFYALLLLAVAGMLLMVAAVDLMVMFFGLEIMAISFYFLLQFPWSNSEIRENKFSNSALLTGIFGSSLVAYGFSLLYGASGSTNVGRIGEALSQRSDLARAVALSKQSGAAGAQMRQLMEARLPSALHYHAALVEFLPTFALVLILLGVLLKTLFFFRKQAGSYATAHGNTAKPAAALMASAGAIALVAFILRILVTVYGAGHDAWWRLVAGLGLAAIFWCGLHLLFSKKLVPRFVYAFGVQLGYVLLGLAAGNETALTGIAYWAFAFVFSTVGIFAALLVLQSREDNSGLTRDTHGFWRRNAAVSTLFLIFIASLAGIPGTAGFLGKYFILKSLFETRHFWLLGFAVLGLLPVFLFCFFLTLRVFRAAPPLMEFNAVRDAGTLPTSGFHVLTPAGMGSATAVALGIAIFVTVAAGLYAEPFLRLARYAFGQ